MDQTDEREYYVANSRHMAALRHYPAKPSEKDLLSLSKISLNNGQRRPVLPLIGVDPDEDTSHIPGNVLLYMNPVQ